MRNNFVSNWGKRLVWGMLFLAWWALVYFGTNRLGVGVPRALPFILGEASIPLVPWALPVYWSVFVQGALAIFLLRPENVKRFLGAAALLVAIHGFVFLLYPTASPRPPALPAEASAIEHGLYSALVAIDHPRNAFPSLHVALAVLFALAVYSERPKLGLIFLVWGLAVAASTLLLKQHYILDVFGGFLTASAVYAAVFLNRVQKRTIEP